MNPLGIECLSTFGLDPVALIELTGDLGCSHVTLNLGPAANRLSIYPAVLFRHDTALQRAMKAALADNGVRIGMVEGFALLPDNQADDFARDLDMVAGLGAAAICAVSLERDVARSHAQFARLTELASERGLVVTSELGAGGLRRLDKALAAVAAVSHPSFKLLVDTMHFFRFGGTVAAFAALDPALIGHIQLCDVPMPALIDDYMTEALYERRAPGDGDLPLREFLRAVPDDVVIGLEVPIRSEAEAGLGPHERLARCLAQARTLMA
ncbi:sugar phosphate isomerase/epimerase family protein [Novosphingobium sp. JCM 18896]|uniref:sugar phosphate isomerase/epimerase family protein n=1 Tax=Novosphingobium sp. JCM 18896 TaxID=2989731 RepID=UPI0022226874|nr:sugar phosphate isomerase/epimerase [Novosphingobium sp. JCM 18896]MCW1428881.1 sugar phosphate isomerase/epimerase [Novosphingobium sp. JCM 18896]